MENGNNAIQIREKTDTAMTLAAWTQMKDQASVMLKSGFLPQAINTPEKAIAVAMAGRELGIGFMESLRSINIIQGKPAVSPQLMLALANRTHEVEDIKIDATDQGAVVTIKRRGRQSHTESFGIGEATAMGLMGKDNYRKQPATMFKWRALAAALRVTFPDAISGLYTPDELGLNVGESETGEMVIERSTPSLSVAKDVAPQSTKTTEPTWPSPALEPISVLPDPAISEEIKSRPAPETIAKGYETFKGLILDTNDKEYAPGKWKYGYKCSDGLWYSDFSKTNYELAQKMKISEEIAIITYKIEKGKKKEDMRMYRNVVKIESAAG